MGHRIVPAAEARTENTVVNSRFIASAAPSFTVDQAKAFITRISQEFPDATHNVPAFIIGHGSSTILHSSDDGEPSGTAGRPALAVLQGSQLGDVVVVVTRYFGGTKLGTGGLVRAYSDAVRSVLRVLPKGELVPTHTVYLEMAYNLYERVRSRVEVHGGQVLEQDFAGQVSLTARFAEESLPPFQADLRELSRGSLQAEVIESRDMIMPLGADSEAS
ncbi:MAG: IMPACT family protein [Anaerolineales bacterium]